MKRFVCSLRFSVLAALILAAWSLVVPAVKAAPAGKIYIFNGKIQSVDIAARSFTLSGDGKTYAFRVTGETKITWGRKTLEFAI